MAAFFLDNFVEAVDTSLASHTPNTGTSWSVVFNDDATTVYEVVGGLGEAQQANSIANTGVIYNANATYPSANYEVQMTLVSQTSAAASTYLIVRMTDVDNLYAVRLSAEAGTGTSQLYKKVTGIWTALGSTFTTPAAGSVCKLQISGTTLKFFDDTVEVASATDSDLSATGKGGLAGGGGAELVNANNDMNVGTNIDTYSITEVAAGTKLLTLLGVGT